MAERARLRVATERQMDGMFGPIKLSITREALDLSRVSSPAASAS